MGATAGMCLLVALGACASPSFSGAPPTVVCGTSIDDSAMGAVVEDGAVQHRLGNASAGGFLFIQVSHDCRHGAAVSWTPALAATLVREAKADDGLAAAVVLKPASPTAAFRLSAVRDGKTVAYVAVSLR